MITIIVKNKYFRFLRNQTISSPVVLSFSIEDVEISHLLVTDEPGLVQIKGKLFALRLGQSKN